jgi:hypothetical protein
VKDRDVVGAEVLEHLQAGPVGGEVVRAVGRRDDDERRMPAAGEIEHTRQDVGSHLAAADDDERAMLGPFDARLGE